MDVLEEDLLQKQLKLIKIPRHGLIIEGDLIVKHQLLVTVQTISALAYCLVTILKGKAII
ncbi:hypothetical protein ACR31S_05045 [Streptococcus iniae]